jgi:predicted RNA polymerase sigma factor
MLMGEPHGSQCRSSAPTRRRTAAGAVLERLGQIDQARESYRRACRAGNSAACTKLGPGS